jgi:hypothetical protein
MGLSKATHKLIVPKQYRRYSDVFSTFKIEHLPPYRGEVDHVIDLIPNAIIPNTR